MRFTTFPDSKHAQFALRPLSAADLSHWANYLNLPAVYEHTSWNHPSASDLASYLGNESTQDPASRLRLAIATRDGDVLAGTIGFHTVSPDNRSAELAYDLDPAYWGRGLARSMGADLVRWAQEEVGLLRIQATVLETNARSIATLERLSFVREGLLRSYRLVRGRPGNFFMYALVVSREDSTP